MGKGRTDASPPLRDFLASVVVGQPITQTREAEMTSCVPLTLPPTQLSDYDGRCYNGRAVQVSESTEGPAEK